MFFMQAKVFADIQDSSLSVSVTGDVDEAKSFQSSELENSGMTICRVDAGGDGLGGKCKYTHYIIHASLYCVLLSLDFFWNSMYR